MNSGSFKRIQLMKAKKNKPSKGKDTGKGKDSGTYGYGNGGYGNGCPPGVPMVQCFGNPCDLTDCPAYPNANCTANYCGGCHAIFTKNGQTVNCGCPPGQPPVACTADPCDTTSCSSCPRAHCAANYCGGCHAIFTDDNGVVNCDDDSYACTVTYSEEGERCGGNTVDPPECAPGLVCTPVPGSSGPFGDVGGVCKAPVACTMEAKLCPDGYTYVGRDQNHNCEFSPCPTGQSGTVCTLDVLDCPDGSFVARDPDHGCQFPPCSGSSYGKQGKTTGYAP